MSKGDGLWKSNLDEDELISLSISLAESSLTHSPAKDFVDAGFDEKSAKRATEPAKVNGSKASDVDVLRSDGTVIVPNADPAPGKQYPEEVEEVVNGAPDSQSNPNSSNSRQYMYYGAGEKSPPDSQIVAASTTAAAASDDGIASTRAGTQHHMQAASTPADTDVPETFATPAMSSPELARKSAALSSPMLIASTGTGLERSPWGIRDDPQRVRNRQGSEQLLGSPSSPSGRAGAATSATAEPVYSKVYDTIDVEPMPPQKKISSAAPVVAIPSSATSTMSTTPAFGAMATTAEEDSYDLPAHAEPPPPPRKRPSDESIVEISAGTGVNVSPASKKQQQQPPQQTTPPRQQQKAAASTKKLSRSAGSPGRQSHQPRLHLFCRSQSYSLERAERSDRVTYPEAMNDGIYRPVEEFMTPLRATTPPPPLKPPLPPSSLLGLLDVSPQLMEASSPTLTATTATMTPGILTTPAMLPIRASSPPETLGPVSPTTPSVGDDTDSVWWTDVSFRDRLSNHSSAAVVKPLLSSSCSSSGGGGFILTAPPDPSVADQVESASLVSDAAIREPQLCSFRRSIQENLLAQRQPSRTSLVQTYRTMVEPENHSSFFHVHSPTLAAVDFAEEDGAGETEQKQHQQPQELLRRTASTTSSVSSVAASSSSESRVSTDSSLEAALVLEADDDCPATSGERRVAQKPPRKQHQKQKKQQKLDSSRRNVGLSQSQSKPLHHLAPFVAHLPEPLRCGRKIIVGGQLNESTRRATISLKNRNSCTQPSPARTGEEEFQVKLEIRPDGFTELSCRQFNGKVWTGDQKAVTDKYLPEENGSAFTIEIQTTSSGFYVRFEDAFCIQPHTLPFSNFTHLVLDGNSDYQSVDFPEELELPYSEEFPQSLDLVSHILVKLQMLKSPQTTQISFGFDHGAAMLCVLDLTKQTVAVGRTVPETGGFLCETKVNKVLELTSLRSILLRIEPASVLILLEGKPVVSYNLLDRKVYITSFFVDGNFTLKDVTWKEKRAPKLTPLPSTFQVGRVIRVTGRLPAEGYDSQTTPTNGGGSPGSCCNITLAECSPADAASVTAVGLCLRCEPRKQPTLSSAPSSPPGTTVSLPIPPLEPSQRFEACILYRLDGFELLQLGDHHYPVQHHQPMLAPHQLEPQRLSHVLLSGGAIYYEVEFPEQLHLPYINRFPVSLKESRFVTAEIASTGLSFLRAQRPTTISFALCCSPGDSGLKPLVCEFNMAQGYASVAWADTAGQLRDEETRKFDPRLTNDVEVVALHATDTEYILSCNERSVLKYSVRHDLNEIHYVLIDGDAAITSVKFEGRVASFGCCIN